MSTSDLPCDVDPKSEPENSRDVTEGVALRQILYAAQRYGSQPTERDAYSTLIAIYAIRLLVHNHGIESAEGVCLRALERERQI